MPGTRGLPHDGKPEVDYRDLSLIDLTVILIYFLLFPLVQEWARFFTHFYAIFVIAAAASQNRVSAETGDRRSA